MRKSASKLNCWSCSWSWSWIGEVVEAEVDVGEWSGGCCCCCCNELRLRCGAGAGREPTEDRGASVRLSLNSGIRLSLPVPLLIHTQSDYCNRLRTAETTAPPLAGACLMMTTGTKSTATDFGYTYRHTETHTHWTLDTLGQWTVDTGPSCDTWFRPANKCTASFLSLSHTKTWDTIAQVQSKWQQTHFARCITHSLFSLTLFSSLFTTEGRKEASAHCTLLLPFIRLTQLLQAHTFHSHVFPPHHYLLYVCSIICFSFILPILSPAPRSISLALALLFLLFLFFSFSLSFSFPRPLCTPSLHLTRRKCISLPLTTLSSEENNCFSSLNWLF